MKERERLMLIDELIEELFYCCTEVIRMWEAISPEYRFLIRTETGEVECPNHYVTPEARECHDELVGTRAMADLLVGHWGTAKRVLSLLRKPFGMSVYDVCKALEDRYDGWRAYTKWIQFIDPTGEVFDYEKVIDNND